MKNEIAVNIPEKTASDGLALLEDFYELVKSRSPHKLSSADKRLLNRFKRILDTQSKDSLLNGRAEDLFWKINNKKELWYKKKNISLMEVLGLVEYLESNHNEEKFDIKALKAKSKLKSLVARHGDKAAEYILTGNNLACYETLKKAEIELSEHKKAAV